MRVHRRRLSESRGDPQARDLPLRRRSRAAPTAVALAAWPPGSSPSAPGCAAPAAEVWARVTTAEGVNAELMPLVRMTIPRGREDFSIADIEDGTTIGRSWLLLFGLIPFDYDDIHLERIEPGRAFHERSTMLTSAAGSTTARSIPTASTPARSRTGCASSRGCRSRRRCCARSSARSSAAATGGCAGASGRELSSSGSDHHPAAARIAAAGELARGAGRAPPPARRRSRGCARPSGAAASRPPRASRSASSSTPGSASTRSSSTCRRGASTALLGVQAAVDHRGHRLHDRRADPVRAGRAQRHLGPRRRAAPPSAPSCSAPARPAGCGGSRCGFRSSSPSMLFRCMPVPGTTTPEHEPFEQVTVAQAPSASITARWVVEPSREAISPATPSSTSSARKRSA